MQGATGCFLKMEGISKSRLSPETIRRLPPLFYTKRDPERYSSGRAAQELPGGMALVRKASEEPTRLVVVSL